MASVLKCFVTPQKNAWECQGAECRLATVGFRPVTFTVAISYGKAEEIVSSNMLPSVLLGNFCCLDREKWGQSCESGTCQLLLQWLPGGLDTKVLRLTLPPSFPCSTSTTSYCCWSDVAHTFGQLRHLGHL